MMIRTARRIQGVEEYYFSRKLQEVRSLDTSEFPVINLGIGSPDRAPSPGVIDKLYQTALGNGNHGYQNYKGIPGLRKAIAEFNKRIYGVSLNAENEILPLMGSKEGILHISMAFVDEGDTVLIPDPGYPTYSSVSQLVGAKVDTYTLQEDKNWAIDFEALETKDLSGVKLMWINSPHMPTGSRLSMQDLQRVVDLARKHNFLLVNDNPYSMVLNDRPTSVLSLNGAMEVALELNSLSKSHNMAGWRVGWVAGNETHVNAVLKVKSNMDSGMFLGIQQAAIEALEQGESWFDELNSVYGRRKEKALDILETLECHYAASQTGLFVWGKAPDHVKDIPAWIDSILYQTKVFITPGFIFGKAGERFIRLSLCATEQNLHLAHERILKWAELATAESERKEVNI